MDPSTTTVSRLVKCFVESLGIPQAEVTDNLTYNTIKQWDSVGHMALVASLEAEFNVMLDTDEIIAMSSVLMAKQILQKHGILFP